MKTNFLKQLFLGLAMVLSMGAWGQQQTITATFSCDNFYAIYAGNENGVTRKLAPTGFQNFIEVRQSETLWSPQTYNFQMDKNEWLYIIAARDRNTAQGLIGEFKGERSLVTGDSNIQVYPTNSDFWMLNSLNQNVSITTITNNIIVANTNNGWKTPHSGPLNGENVNNHEYRYSTTVNNVSNTARWIWNYNEILPLGNEKPFIYSNVKPNKDGNYLIYRFPVSALNIQKPVIPIGSDCNCWKPIGTKYNGLDLDNLGRITPFQIDKNNSTSIADRQVLDVALNHVYPEYHRDSNGQFGIKFTFAMKPELRTYLESYLRYINGTFKCVNMIRVSYSVNDVTGVTGLPNNTAVTPAFNLEMYIDNNGVITYNNGANWNSYTFNGYYPSPKVRDWDSQNATMPLLPQIGKEYKTGISIVALSRGGSNEFEDTKKCGFDYNCSILSAYYSWIPSSSKSSTPFYEIVDKNNKVIKIFSPNTNNKK